MKTTVKILALLSALALAGCAGTKGLRKKFADKESSLGYLGEGSGAAGKTVSIKDYRFDASLPPRNEVTRTKSLVIPAIFFTYWGHDFAVQLGEGALDTPVPGFGPQSLANDLRRAGFVLDSAGGTRVSVRVNKLRSGSLYFKQNYVLFLVFAYSIHTGEGAKNIESSLEADLFVERAGKVDSIRFVHTESAAVPASHRTGGRNLQQTTVDAMAETLALCFKNLNARVIEEVSKGGG